MNNFPIKYEGKTYWIARNVAVSCFVFAYLNNEWCVLANQRGDGSADFQGKWNAPCGYLDFDETTEQAAIREVYEETGVQLNSARFWGFEDSPSANLQNVTFRYYSVIGNPQLSTVNVSTEARGGELNEVSAVAWIPVKNVYNFEWAFGHDKLITKWVEEFIVNENNKMDLV